MGVEGAMNQDRVGAELIWQDPYKAHSHLYRKIRHHLSSPEILSFRLAAAYVNWGGLSLVSEALERFLEHGKTLRMIFGTGNSVTTPDALLYALYLRKRYPQFEDARAFQWEYANSEFHPKYYEFTYPDRVVTLVGSSNLTNGGFAFNHELSVGITAANSASARKSCQRWWRGLWNKSQEVTPSLIRSLCNKNALGRELGRKGSDRPGEAIKLKITRPRKPLFRYLLEEDDLQPKLKHELLAAGDSLTEKPSSLYLEILHETGGGHQIQLPVATLGAFFGVGKGEAKDVTFHFPGEKENIQVSLTHFENHTHRVRLRPLKDVPRPGIVVFERTKQSSTYNCSILTPAQYQPMLRLKCPEQTRRDSRHWGLEE